MANEDPLFLADRTQAELGKLCIKYTNWTFIRKILHTIDNEISREVRRPGGKRKSTWDAVTITPYLRQCLPIIESKLIEFVRYYSPLQWLWYLRRIPVEVFLGGRASTAIVDRQLAETITGSYRVVKSSQRVGGNTLVYPINDSVAMRLMKFIYIAQYLSHFHVALRYAGKGSRFTLNEDGLLTHIIDESIEEAIKIYDDRMETSNTFLGTAGTVLIDPEPVLSQSIMIVSPLRTPKVVPSFFGRIAEGSQTDVTVYTQYGSYFTSLDKLSLLLTDSRLAGLNWPPAEAGNILLFMRIVACLLPHMDTGLTTISRYGYHIILNPQIFFEESDYIFEDAKKFVLDLMGPVQLPNTMFELVSMLERMKGSTWPLIPGSCVRREDNVLCLDLASASSRLHSLLEFPKNSGDIANARASHFEDMVQDIIDHSSWAPQGELRKIRRRAIKLAGQSITDIDAIAAKGDMLILVSCKSTIYSGLYDVGDYQVIRNANSTVTSAVGEWNKKVALILSTRKGDNYDFSAYSKIQGIVCTPFPVYVSPGPALAEVIPGLYAASSIMELSEWLDSN